jgi:hypothetical protein
MLGLILLLIALFHDGLYHKDGNSVLLNIIDIGFEVRYSLYQSDMPLDIAAFNYS